MKSCILQNNYHNAAMIMEETKNFLKMCEYDKLLDTQYKNSCLDKFALIVQY